MNRRSVAALSLLVFLSLVTAQACGPDFYPDVFVRQLRPDHPKEFAAGKLGVLLPTFPRADLAVAFRYLNGGSLNAVEQQAYQPSYSYNEQEWEQQWRDEEAEEKKTADPAVTWAALRARFNPSASPAEQGNPNVVQGPSKWVYLAYYQNCQADAFRNAAVTLQSRAKTWGEKSPELADWLKGQDAVFANCQTKALSLPSAAPAAGPALLKADRAYQIAAAEFYAAQFVQARKAFEAIGQDASSPWSGLARYLAARCLVRQAFNDGGSDPGEAMAGFEPKTMRQAADLLQSLLKDKPSGISPQAIQNELDLVRLRTEPAARVHELGAALAGPESDPNYRQHLRDITWYLDAKLDQSAVREDFGAEGETTSTDAYSKTYLGLAPLRSSATLVDWLVTFQSPAPEAADHALAEWKRTHEPYWLLAAISKATEKSPDAANLVAAAAEVKPGSPAWESLTYHRLRLLIRLGRADEARALLDRLLPGIKAAGRDSSTNAYLGLRMSAAASLDEFLIFAPRKVLLRSSQEDSSLDQCAYVMKDPKRKYDCNLQINPTQFSADAVGWFNSQAPLATLVQAAESDALPPQLRRTVAMMAWVRGVLLKDDAAAARLFPLLPEKLQQQAGPGTGFRPLMALLRNPGLRPYLDAGVQRSYSYDFVESYRDNWWSPDWGAYDYRGYKTPMQANAVAFQTPAQRASAASEIATLQKQGGACVGLGQRTLDYVNGHPTDPDAPESLYLLLRMIRYSGQDYSQNDPPPVQDQIRKQVQAVKASAARLLRQRYAASPWTKKAAPFVG